ncbi:YukJ family protein [Roseibium litorale]|uniref:YukJ family protein n=1 Tax=Roseibium litorale TaxID=2803841 RepID=A0ABR9CMC2_9HYPH|nr:YukJ family protein [Roseibium litorale]MBD8892013.1 YukJ family protein [Roseibium litorale]
MPIRNYCLLKGKASDLTLDDDDIPHIEIRVEAGWTSYRIAVNIRSQQPPHDLLFAVNRDFQHPMLPVLLALPEGMTDIAEDNPQLALDYVRGGFLTREDMQVAPCQRSGPGNDLRDVLESLTRQAIDEDHHLTFYAFGESWGPERGKPDLYFGFSPGNGLHNIHMNQGSTGKHLKDNGPNQDGGLLIHSEETGKWTGIFLAFQSQSWVTDPETGNPPHHRRVSKARAEDEIRNS